MPLNIAIIKTSLANNRMDSIHIPFIYLFVRTHEALEHLASFTSSRKTISQLRIEPPNTPFNLGTYSPSSRILGSCQTIHIPFILMKDKVIPLSLDNPQDIIAKEQPNQAKPPKVFPQTLLK